jgi:hypothetical protein
VHLFLLRPDQIAGCCTYNTVHLTFHPQHWLSVSPFYNRPSAMTFLRLFWEITCTYTFCDRHSRLQCVYRKERPYLCIKAKKIAAACLALRTGTVASFWTVARKFRDADVHWHPLQVNTLGRSDSTFLRGGRKFSPSHRSFISTYIYILWTYILWTESAILEFKGR